MVAISFENPNLGFESINLKASFSIFLNQLIHFQAFKSMDSKPRLSVKIHIIKKPLFHDATTVGHMSNSRMALNQIIVTKTKTHVHALFTQFGQMLISRMAFNQNIIDIMLCSHKQIIFIFF
jgi:hypothetical protein